MNEDLDLTEILKDCPKGTKLYSPLYGDVELVFVSQFEHIMLPIGIKSSKNTIDRFTKDGRIFAAFNGECMLFPSKEQRDWSKFKPKPIMKPKFDPRILNAFNKVLVRDDYTTWRADFVAEPSHFKNEIPLTVGIKEANMVIPWNEETKHLVGTNEEAPEFYRYWED